MSAPPLLPLPDSATAVSASTARDAPLPVLGHLASRWEPPTGSALVTHAGEPVLPGRLYLAPPPLEIGEILSAHSNMEGGKGAEAQTGKRLLSAGGGALAGILILLYISYRGRFSFDLTLGILFYGLAGLIGAIIGYAVAKPKYETSFVGKNGVAFYHYGGKNKPIGKAEVLNFDNAADLLVKQINHYHNGVYTGTNYVFVWNDAAGKPVHTIKGDHNNKDGMPSLDHPFWYALAAETAWTNVKLPALVARVRRGETVSFPVKGKGTVGIAPDGVVVEMGKRHEVVPFDAIGDFGIKGGEVSIKRVGAKNGFLGIGADGVYKFPYNSLANARQFLALLATIAGHAESPEEREATETQAQATPDAQGDAVK